MTVCINCQKNPVEPGHLCEACTERMIDNIMDHVSAEDAQKPVDQLDPRKIEFEVPK